MPTFRTSVLLCLPLLLLGFGCSSSSEDGTQAPAGNPASPGATGSSAKLKGIWTGSAAGVDVTFEFSQEVDNAGTIIAIGTISTGNPKCLANGQAAGELTKTTASLLGNGSGSVSSASSLKVTGELAGSKLTGKLEVVSASGECTIAKTDIVLTRT